MIEHLPFIAEREKEKRERGRERERNRRDDTFGMYHPYHNRQEGRIT